MNREDAYFGCGFLAGVLIVFVLWYVIANITEKAKVEQGYLTYENKIYKVEFYNELKYPEKEE